MQEHFTYAGSRELVSLLDQVAQRIGSRAQVFDDFLTVTVCVLAGGTMEEEYLRTVARYTAGEKGKRHVDTLAAMFAKLAALMEQTRDILGDVFQVAITRGEHGQFLTPESLCTLMAELSGPEGATVHDCCCGSGRLLLAAAQVNRNRLFIGQDIDLRCVKMTAINLALRNLYGYVIWGDSLRKERKLIYQTGFASRGVIRLVQPEETPALMIPDERAPVLTESFPSPQPTLFDSLE